jgi:hypothetical protein
VKLDNYAKAWWHLASFYFAFSWVSEAAWEGSREGASKGPLWKKRHLTLVDPENGSPMRPYGEKSGAHRRWDKTGQGVPDLTSRQKPVWHGLKHEY